MLFSLFLFHSSEIQQKEYSLIPPLETTEIGEIGNWTIQGTATNLKNSVRLTSAVPSSIGSICQRVPTLFKEWSIELEIKASNPDGNNDKPGHGIWFFYSQEVCPEFSLDFNGFTFWVNTSSTDSNGYSNVYFAKGNQNTDLSKLKPVGKVRARDEKKPLRIQISRRFDRLTVDATKDTILERIVDEDIKGTPDYGYFTLSAVTTSERVDNNDILSMRVYSMSPIDHPNKNHDFSTENRKFIENSKRERRKMKERRHKAMETVLKFLEESKKSNKKLNAKTDLDLKEAVKVIDEAYRRSLNTMTLDTLEQFIQETVDATVTTAQKKIELAQAKYSETQQDIDELWSSLKRQLVDLAIEEKEALQLIQQEVLEYAKHINFANTKINPDSTADLKKEAANLTDSNLTNILLIISLIEIVLYLIFFLYMRRKTDNFKKRD